MYSIKKFVAVFFTFIFLIVIFPMNASAETAIHIDSSGSQYANFHRQITSDVTAFINPVYDSQALHTKGYTTTIGVDSSVTNGSSASVSLTAGVDSVFAELSATLEVSTNVSFTTGTSISYTIGASTASGRYRIEHVFPRKKVIQQRVLSDSTGEHIQWQRTISYAPVLHDAYRRLNRYANP